ncbi:MAG: hypothetical protein ACRDQ4_02770 [Pseudonocardiaceae bacterium]
MIWPHLTVHARWYRFQVLNASNSRFYTLALHDDNGAVVPGAPRQIGSDDGLLPAPPALDAITLAPAERADVLIDFHAFRGRSLTLVNTGPGTPNSDVMQFKGSSGQSSTSAQSPTPSISTSSSSRPSAAPRLETHHRCTSVLMWMHSRCITDRRIVLLAHLQGRYTRHLPGEEPLPS